MNLFEYSVLTALLLVATGAILALDRPSLNSLIRKFPRSQKLSVAFLAIGLAWFLYRHVQNLSDADFGNYRVAIGLFAFFYLVLHVASYVVVDQYFDWIAIWNDIVKRIYITVGMAALLILTALAATSWSSMVKRLGGKAWNRLHQGVYLAGILAAILPARRAARLNVLDAISHE